MAEIFIEVNSRTEKKGWNTLMLTAVSFCPDENFSGSFKTVE